MEIFVFDRSGLKLNFLNSNVELLGVVLSIFNDLVEKSVLSNQESVIQKVSKVLINDLQINGVEKSGATGLFGQSNLENTV